MTLKAVAFTYSTGKVHNSSAEKVSSETLFDVQSITKVVASASLLEKPIEAKKNRFE